MCHTVSEFSTRRLVSSAQCLVQSIIRLSMVLINQISSGIQNPENTYVKHTMIANDQKVELLPRFKAPEGSQTFPRSQFSPTSWLMSTLQRHQKNDCSASCETMEHRKDFSRTLGFVPWGKSLKNGVDTRPPARREPYLLSHHRAGWSTGARLEMQLAESQGTAKGLPWLEMPQHLVTGRAVRN